MSEAERYAREVVSSSGDNTKALRQRKPGLVTLKL